jgi:protein-tyrosine phosphatase
MEQTENIKQVMLVCSANICRSPMAAAMLADALRRAGAAIKVESAGLTALGGCAADAQAIKFMDERGLDIHAHRATQFTAHRGLESDLILVMSTDQRRFIEENWPLLHGRVYRLGHWGNFDIGDPYQHGEPAFRKALKTIDAGLAQWLEIIAA